MRIEYWTTQELYDVSFKPEYSYLTKNFRYFYPLDLNPIYFRNPNYEEHYLVAFSQESIIVGLLCCSIDTRNKQKIFGLSYVSVHKKYTRRNISKELLRRFFELYSEKYRDYSMYISHYSEDGVMYVYPQIVKLAQEFQIEPLNLHQSHG